MLYREIIAVCSEIHTKHINTLRGQNVELFNVKLVVFYIMRPLGFEGIIKQMVPINTNSNQCLYDLVLAL
jgi:hypothetical protein